ncbi:unnamed protein product [Paramecium pentaurelia]|uniref:Uncharacterized protein n=1 Tax=Paramecium pentaurelia TaxID=43138 RepID=A0A8S1YHA5_9CILI|nr:unnamed protein product [Paramecium pentaurelia]
MAELTKEEKREKSKQMKDKMKYVEQQARFRKAQTELRDNGLENTTTNTKREIMKALENEMDDQQLKQYQELQKKLVRMNYYGSFFGLTSAAILPRTFRFYQKLGLVSRVTVCVSTFLITQKGATFKYLCDVDDFEVDFIEKHKSKFLETSFENVLGALSEVFSKCNYQFDNSKPSESFDKLASTFQSKLDTNKFKTNLDKYIEKVKQKIQSKDENDGSICLSSQYNDISKQNDQQTTGLLNSIKSKVIPETIDQQIQTDTIMSLCNLESSVILIDNGCQIKVEQIENLTQTEYDMIDATTNTIIYEDNTKRMEQNQLKLYSQEVSIQIYSDYVKIKSQDFQCQVDQQQDDSQNIVLNQRLENNSDQQQQSYHSSDLIDNLQIIHDQINEEFIKCQCGKSIFINKKKLIDVECQYDKSLNTQQTNIIDMEFQERFKHIRIRSRCMSQTNQNNEKIQINDEDQITFLENELQLKNELLETKNQVIFKLHSQIEDLHKLINDQKDSARNRNDSDSDLSNESDNQKIDNLLQQIQTDADIQHHLTKQMLQYSEETRNLEQQIRELRDQNQDLKEELDKLTIQITKLKEQQAEMEDNNAKEIDIINEDYQDKLSKQNMIIDDLQQQINSLSISPMGLPQLSMPQTMKYMSQQQFQTVGSDSQQSKGSNCKTKEEKQQLMRNIKRMTTMTAGLMSNKQDYTTLGVLGKIDQYKSQQKLESFNKLN